MLHNMIDQAAYMAHGYCLLWKPWLIAMHAGSDFFIFLSYMAIPFAIWSFVRRREDLELKPLAILFASFIFLCGLSHAVQGLTLWWPVYETQAYIKAATAIVSVITAFVIFPLVPKALAIPSPRQLCIVNEGLAAEVAAHRTTLAELEKTKDELEVRVAERTQGARTFEGPLRGACPRIGAGCLDPRRALEVYRGLPELARIHRSKHRGPGIWSLDAGDSPRRSKRGDGRMAKCDFKPRRYTPSNTGFRTAIWATVGRRLKRFR